MNYALTLAERMALVPGISARRLLTPWLNSALVATDDARERLRAWYDASDRLAGDQDPIRERVVYYGDPEMLDPIVEALGMMAPPARDFVMSCAFIVGVGWSRGGWTHGGQFRPQRDRIIVLSGRNREARLVRNCMLHEAAHVWLESQSDAPVLSEHLFSLLFEHHAAKNGDSWRSDFVAKGREEEKRAESLAAVWAASERGGNP